MCILTPICIEKNYLVTVQEQQIIFGVVMQCFFLLLYTGWTFNNNQAAYKIFFLNQINLESAPNIFRSVLE